MASFVLHIEHKRTCIRKLVCLPLMPLSFLILCELMPMLASRGMISACPDEDLLDCLLVAGTFKGREEREGGLGPRDKGCLLLCCQVSAACQH